jgi:hypothetical protein
MPSSIGTPIVHNENFVRHVMKAQFQVEMLHGGCYATFLVTRWNHDGELGQRRQRWVGSGCFRHGSRAVHKVQPLRMLLRMRDDLFEDVTRSARWFPTPSFGHEGRVEHDPG